VTIIKIIYHKIDSTSIGLRKMLKIAITSWVINGYHWKYPFKDFAKSNIDSWYLTSGCDSWIEGLSWQLSGIGNIVDYHPVENRRVFVARASPTTETGEIAPNHWTSTDLFSAAVYKRAYFCDGTDCCFPSHISLAWSMQPHWQYHIAWKDNSDSRCHRVFFHYRFGQKRFIFLAVSRI